jgi:hypothetical protein
MTRAVKARAKRRRQAPPPPPKRSPWVERGLVGLVALAVVVVAAGLWRVVGGDQMTTSTDAGPVHVHGLGVNPADEALFIATHTGLYRSGEGDSKSVRVGDNRQDTMGFTVAGPNRFLGSGHPDFQQDLPPLLGLIESTDGGESWEPISLLGEADFHVLRFAGNRLYGYDVTNDRLLASTDTGRTWQRLSRPAPMLDLAVDPSDSSHLLASGESQFGLALFESTNGGKDWTTKGSVAGLLAWPVPDRLYAITGAGEVFRSPDAGRRLDLRGRIGGQPAAFLAQGPDDLYVALHDGTIQRSTDGGATWTVRSTP